MVLDVVVLTFMGWYIRLVSPTSLVWLHFYSILLSIQIWTDYVSLGFRQQTTSSNLIVWMKVLVISFVRPCILFCYVWDFLLLVTSEDSHFFVLLRAFQMCISFYSNEIHKRKIRRTNCIHYQLYCQHINSISRFIT